MLEPHWKDCFEGGDLTSRKAQKIWRVLKTFPAPRLNLDRREQDNELGLTPYVMKQRIRNFEKETVVLSKNVASTMKRHANNWDKFFVGRAENGYDVHVIGVRKETGVEIQERIDKARMGKTKEDQDLKRAKRKIMQRMIESDPKMAKRILELAEKKAGK